MGNNLSGNIKMLRTRAGISQVQLAHDLNVSKQCASNWENDNVQPSVEMLVRLADYFRVSTDMLLSRETDCTLDVSGLTGEQRGHITLLVRDLAELNRKAGR